jgi:O-succinylbenzoate synthase
VKIFTHPYTLQPGTDPTRAARRPRSGALLRVEFDDGAIGYADLLPLTEFGHAPLEEHLASLSENRPSRLTEIALTHARTDATARRAGISLFAGLPDIRSHALFTHWSHAPRSVFERCVDDGYDLVKLKIGRDPELEADALNGLSDLPIRWRLDANASAGTEVFLQQLEPQLRAKIEFLEDPSPYDAERWTTLATRMNITLALDWELPDSPAPWPGAQILVIKPASQDALALAQSAANFGMKIVVTHSMDHPLGQSVALWTAQKLRQSYGQTVLEGGLQAVGLFLADNFSAQIRCDGPQTLPPPGTGFGFDEILESIDWQPSPEPDCSEIRLKPQSGL